MGRPDSAWCGAARAGEPRPVGTGRWPGPVSPDRWAQAVAAKFSRRHPGGVPARRVRDREPAGDIDRAVQTAPYVAVIQVCDSVVWVPCRS